MNRQQIIEFKQLLSRTEKIVGFTGAGVSTESGIPDYRSAGGIWDRFKPVTIDEFMSSEQKRIQYWQRKVILWEQISRAKPGKTHVFFKQLYDRQRLNGLITQNIDGLHETSGLPDELIVNLHGTNLSTICMSCGKKFPSSILFKHLDLTKGSPRCEICDGYLKPDTISFGQQLDPVNLKRATFFSQHCQLMIVAGSSLVVQPAASFPLIAKQSGARLAIITISETPLDVYADFLFKIKLGEFWDIYEQEN
ncbi:MAG: hypothetical protein APR63_10235 [Desulfuromonas sp. SDB]|nr:MAG: hypothetical protein APR63_10235 [Desulfuromonas sp. SDB]